MHPQATHTRFRRLLLLGGAALLLMGADPIGIREDELLCEEAHGKLNGCCPNHVSGVDCRYRTSGCMRYYPNIPGATAKSITASSCEEILSSNYCTRSWNVPPSDCMQQQQHVRDCCGLYPEGRSCATLTSTCDPGSGYTTCQRLRAQERSLLACLAGLDCPSVRAAGACGSLSRATCPLPDGGVPADLSGPLDSGASIDLSGPPDADGALDQ